MGERKRRVAGYMSLNDLANAPILPRPLCPFDAPTSRKLFLQSQADGHRVLWIKCQTCSLEYQVRTWRTGGDELVRYFNYCPECGTKCHPNLLRLDNELGSIMDALNPPAIDTEGQG